MTQTQKNKLLKATRAGGLYGWTYDHGHELSPSDILAVLHEVVFYFDLGDDNADLEGLADQMAECLDTDDEA